MTIDEAVFARHSVRKYTSTPLTKEQIEEFVNHINFNNL